MRIFSLLILLTALGQAGEKLYLAAGDHLSVYEIAADSGKLKRVQNLPLPGAGPFTFSPDGSKLYAMASETKKTQIATVAIDPEGILKLLNVAPVNLRAGYLKTDKSGRFIAGNHYGPGKVTLWKLADDAVYRGETAQELTLEPRAHSAVFSTDSRWLLVPATAPNKVFVNRLDAEAGKMIPNDPPFGSGPSGDTEARQPRHLIFHPKLSHIIYTTNERENPGVCAWNWDNEKGTLSPFQNIVSAPEKFEGRISVADLHMTPDGNFLYISNRNILPDKKALGESSIVGFKADPETGQLTLISHTPCENLPRSFCMDKQGKYIYVAGQIENKPGVYRIDQSTGNLEKIEQHEVGNRPIWVEAR